MTVGTMRAAVLGAWAAFFVWLLATGEVLVYIGPRTRWVVVFGSVCLTLATIASLRGAAREADAPSRAEVLKLVSLLIPIALVVAVPRPGLGSLAVSRKLAGGNSAVALAMEPLAPGEEVSFEQLGYALASPENAARVGLYEGIEVDLTGFVSDAGTGIDGAVALTRFSIFCCAADAVPNTVPVRMPAATPPSSDTWLRVQGTVVQDDGAWLVEARTVDEVEEPADPYV